MANPSPLAIGDNVTTGTIVGKMGQTGNAFGIHLHLELSDVSYWDTTRTHFQNPLIALGIPDERGTIVHFDGEVPPVPPTGRKRKKFPWVLYARHLRSKMI